MIGTAILAVKAFYSSWEVWIIAALVAAVVGAFGVQEFKLVTTRLELATLKASVATEHAVQADAARKDEAAQRIEGERRAARQKENDDAATKKLADANAARVRSDAAAASLSQRFAAALAAARQARNDPPPVAGSPPAANPDDVLADVQRRIDQAAGLFADLADKRGIAGAACERDYDALGDGTPRAADPPAAADAAAGVDAMQGPALRGEPPGPQADGGPPAAAPA